MEESENIVEYLSKDGLTTIAKCTKLLNSQIFGASRDIFCAYPAFTKSIEIQSNNILEIIAKLLCRQQIKGSIQRRQKDEQIEMILDCNDAILEKINLNLDFLANPHRRVTQDPFEQQKENTVDKGNSGMWNTRLTPKSTSKSFSANSSANIPRPQLQFKVPVDNNDNTPFLPKITEKPNALKPLSILPEYDEDGNIQSYTHPYEYELMLFEPIESQLERRETLNPKNLSETEYLYVDTKSDLNIMLDDLKKSSKIAIDLEHHHYRSFQGITCLMQISDFEKDYVVDTLALREELQILNEIFTNPKILKIFHGADSDIEWLQRDLGLYVVNMFDTYQASKTLALNRLSLKYLLKRYCDVDTDKQYQLADWRMRPLPEELITYARKDTHYLIFVADKLHNEILDQPNGLNALKVVYANSKEICKKKYFKPKLSSDSYIDIYKRSKRIFDNRQLFALKEIYIWRDKTARLEDESINYVLPNHMLLQIAENLPREMQGILACCNPVPPLVKQHLNILHKIVLSAREKSIFKSYIMTEASERSVLPTKDLTNKLNFIYDITHELEMRDNQMSPFEQPSYSIPNSSSFKAVVDVFDKFNDETEGVKINSVSNIPSATTKFVSPYERFKAVVAVIEKQNTEKSKETEKQVNISLDSSNNESFNINDKNKNIKQEIESSSSEDENLDESNVCKQKDKFDNKNQNSNSLKRKLYEGKESETENQVHEEPKYFQYSRVDFQKYAGGSYIEENIKEKAKKKEKTLNIKIYIQYLRNM